MTWARHEADLTLRNATFWDQVATLAAAIRGIPKEDMLKAAVTEQRRTRRIVRVVIAVVTVLVLAVFSLVIFARGKSMQASHDTDVKVSNDLAGQSRLVSDTDPTLSRLLSVAAWRISNGTIQLWDATTGQQIGSPFHVPLGAVYSVAFSRDGKTLASGDADHTVRLWDVSYLVNVVQDLCTSAGRSLTRSEWSLYAPEVAYQRVCP